MIKGNMQDLANNFERIATAEKTQWLPWYYAAYCTVSASYTESDNSKKDGIADKAEEFITKLRLYRVAKTRKPALSKV